MTCAEFMTELHRLRVRLWLEGGRLRVSAEIITGLRDSRHDPVVRSDEIAAGRIVSARHLLGQAAPRLYRLSPGSGAITDVVNSSSPNNVTGTMTDAGGTNPMRASELASPLENQPAFISALYNSPHSTRWFVLSRWRCSLTSSTCSFSSSRS